METVDVTGSEIDAPAIGIKLALKHGVSEAIAVIQQELAVIEKAVSDSAGMNAMVMRLGKQMTGVNADAAPIASPASVTPPSTDQTESDGLYAANFIASKPAAVAGYVRAGTPPQPGRPASPVASRPHNDTDAALSQRLPQPGNLSVSVQTVSARNPSVPSDLTISAPLTTVSTTPAAPAVHFLSATPSVGQYTKVSPPILLPIAQPSRPVVTQAAPPASPVVLPATQPVAPIGREAMEEADEGHGMTSPLQLDSPTGPRIAPYPQYTAVLQAQRQIGQSVSAGRRIAVGTTAPAKKAVKQTVLPAVQPVFSIRPVPFAWTPLDATSDDAVPSDDLPGTPAAKGVSRPDSEPQQGILILDGSQLGRWVMDHLATQASRPGSGMTGIDPRINATYPGAPSGL